MPRAHVDPIDSELVAFSLIADVVTRPLRFETIAVLLDDQRRGIAVFVVGDTVDPAAMLAVLDIVVGVDRHGDELGAVVLASVRPGGAVDADDIDRWLEASDLLADRGVELLEWFVIGDDVECPRDLLGEPPRW